MFFISVARDDFATGNAKTLMLMKQELTLLERLRAPKPGSIQALIWLCICVVINVFWVRCLLYFKGEEPAQYFGLVYLVAAIAAGIVVGLCFTVDEEAYRKAHALDNIRRRIKNRKA